MLMLSWFRGLRAVVFSSTSNILAVVRVSVFRVFGLFCVWSVGGVYDWEHDDDEAVDARRGAFRDPSPPSQPRSGVGYRFRRCDEFDW